MDEPTYDRYPCTECNATPQLVAHSPYALECQCDDVRVPVVLTQEGLFHPDTGLWTTDVGSVICPDCEDHVGLAQQRNGGFVLVCGCPERAFDPGPLGDLEIFDPFVGQWATVNDI